MYNSLQLANKYLHYYLSASNGKGHGIHSPFVFGFIKNVLRDKNKYDSYHVIESRREKLNRDTRVIEVMDPGAGSAVFPTGKRRVCDIASTSLKSPKFAQLLFRIVQHYHPDNIIELGTSLGITTAYLAAGNPNAKVYTFEGVPPIAALARQGFEEIGCRNIELVEGDFSVTLPSILQRMGTVGLAYVDGNHRKEPTLEYFQRLMERCSSSSVLIFDDIHWSREMEEAWSQVSRHPRVTLSIDLFFLGIVFFNADIKIPRPYTIRF